MADNNAPMPTSAAPAAAPTGGPAALPAAGSATSAGAPAAGSATSGAARATPPQHQPLTGSALTLGTIALSLATFMNVLDTSIANVSIPAISGDLGVSPDQ